MLNPAADFNDIDAFRIMLQAVCSREDSLGIDRIWRPTMQEHHHVDRNTYETDVLLPVKALH